jgi:hypothetical protein
LHAEPVAVPLFAPSYGVHEIPVLRLAYPGVGFSSRFDYVLGDWKVSVASYGKTTVLYRAGGRYLPPGHLSVKERYRNLIYRFPDKVADPATFTAEQLERVARFGSAANRSSAPVSATFIFDAIYDSATRERTERRIVPISFLGWRISVHEMIEAPLGRVEAEILALAARDADVAAFVDTLGSAEGYAWRQIRDTAGRSFHAMGLAIDLLPRGWRGKAVYWNWERAKGEGRWMLIPLSSRWMPPRSVVSAFEREGFIWGGRWPVWDNMHFEYRPELLAAKSIVSARLSPGK